MNECYILNHMKFVSSTPDEGQKAVTETLVHHLRNGKKVLWLVSGGSNIALEVATMQQLSGTEDNLTVMLTDERYGDIGHADSNWQQLLKAGFVDGNATVIPTLLDGLELQETATAYNKSFEQACKAADVVVGQFGMGDDGHIAGILPHSAATQSTDQLVVGYESETYQRITMTFKAFELVDEAYCLAYGESKQPALVRLETAADLADQPAQILKQVPTAYVYNDHITGEYS